jgi:hypothetical protein
VLVTCLGSGSLQIEFKPSATKKAIPCGLLAPSTTASGAATDKSFEISAPTVWDGGTISYTQT